MESYIRVIYHKGLMAMSPLDPRRQFVELTGGIQPRHRWSTERTGNGPILD